MLSNRKTAPINHTVDYQMFVSWKYLRPEAQDTFQNFCNPSSVGVQQSVVPNLLFFGSDLQFVDRCVALMHRWFCDMPIQILMRCNRRCSL